MIYAKVGCNPLIHLQVLGCITCHLVRYIFYNVDSVGIPLTADIIASIVTLSRARFDLHSLLIGKVD